MKIKIISIVLAFTMIVSLISIDRVEAGAPKLVYEIGETTADALLKAQKARKGFKVVEGGESAGEAFTGAMKKGLQDTAIESWEVINGGAFDKTPLKGMPKWLKVTIGTTAFITGADIALDIYGKIQEGKTISTIYQPEYDVKKQSERNLIKIPASGTSASYYGHRVSLEPDTTRVTVDGELVIANKELIGMKDITVQDYFSPEQDDILYFTLWDTAQGTWTTSFIPINYNGPQPIASDVSVPKEHIQKVVEVPQINPSRETQTLIIPNPELVPVKDMDQLINENWDMVSNPEEWLQQNPQADPTPDQEPIPDPDGGGGTGGDGEKPDPKDRTHETSSIDWKKLLTALGGFTYIFPFSIPWDIGRAVDSVFGGFVQGVPPEWEVDLAGMQFTLKIPDTFLSWVPITRGFLVFVFDIGVIYALRKWFGGAT